MKLYVWRFRYVVNKLTFGERLADLRITAGQSQRDLAAELGLSQSTIKSYENGKIYPHMHVLLRMSEYFRVSLDYLCAISDHNLRTDKVEEIFTITNDKQISVGALIELLTSLDDESKHEVYDIITVFIKGGRLKINREKLE